MRKSKGRKSGKAESDKRDDAQNGDPERDSNEEGENEDSEEDVTPKKSSKSHKRQSRSRDDEDEDEDEHEDEHEDDQEDEEENDEKPAKKSKKRKSPSKKGKGKSKKSKKASESEDNSDDEEDSGKTSKKGRKTAASKKDDSDDDDEEVSKEEYEVARIIDVHFKNNGEREFLVRWKGYSSKDDTWEPEAHLNCKDLIAAYLKKCEEVKAKQKRDEEDDGEEVSNKEYEVSRIIDVHFKNNGKREFLVRWKGYSAKDDTWEPEEHLNCKDLINAYLKKCEEARNTTQRETRINRKRTDRFIFNAQDSGRKLSGRHKGKPRKTYFEEE